MASNYLISGVDLDDFFELRGGGSQAPIGEGDDYFVNGVDLRDRYLGINDSDALVGPSTGVYASNDKDLGEIFGANSSRYIVENKLTSTRSTGWNTQVIHEWTITFSSSTARTDFFTYSGQVRVSSSRSGGSSHGANTEWTAMLSSMGTINFEKTETNSTGSGTETSIGDDDLTGTYQTVFSIQGTGAYTSQLYRLQAREDSTTIIRMRAIYDEAEPETIDGTLISDIDQRRLDTLTSATYSTTSNL